MKQVIKNILTLEKLEMTSTRVIIGLILLIFLTMSLVFYYYGVYTIQREVKLIVGNMNTLLNLVYDESTSDQITTQLNQLDDLNMRYYLVVDKKGLIVATNMSRVEVQEIIKSSIPENLAKDGNIQYSKKIKYSHHGNHKHYFYAGAWMKDHFKQGIILVENNHDKAFTSAFILSLTYGGWIFLLGFLALIILRSTIKKHYLSPMSDILDGIEKMNKGKQNYRFPLAQTGEFMEIAQMMNRLTDEIDQRDAQIHQEKANQKVLHQRIHKFEEMKAAMELSIQFLMVKELDEVVEKALQQACMLAHAEFGTIALLEHQTQIFRRRFYYGLSDTDNSIIYSLEIQSVLDKYGKEVIQTGHPRVFENIQNDPEFQMIQDMGELKQYFGFISFPLIIDNINLGVMSLYFEEEIKIDERSLKSMVMFTHQLSLGIQRALFDEKIAFKARQSTILHDFSKKIGANLSLADILKIILEEVAQMLNVDYGIIRLLNKDTQELEVKATLGISDDDKAKLPILHPGLGLAGEIVKTIKPIYVADVHKDPRLRNYYLPEEEKSYLGVPLNIGDNIIGVLACMTKKHRIFTDDEIAFLTVISTEAAISIENARLYSETKEMTLIDALTQMYNVRRLHPQLEDEITRAERYKRFVSFVMIDIDHFKHYNDTHGHPRGDIVIKKVAQMIRQQVRDIDQVYRYGGEELCIVLPETDKETAAVIAERVRQVIAEYPFFGEQSQPGGNLTISAGVASYPDDAVSKEGLIAHADKALYLAKEAGRNRVCLYEESSIPTGV